MRKKLLRTYTLLGLMLGSLVTPGQAGEYEQAFIEEVNRGAPQLRCRKGPDQGSKPTTIKKYENVSLGSCTQTTYPSSGFANPRVTTTYLSDWRWVEYPSRTDPVLIASVAVGEWTETLGNARVKVHIQLAASVLRLQWTP